MKIPKKLKVDGHSYDVVSLNDGDMQKLSGDGSPGVVHGATCESEMTIFLNGSDPKSKMEETFFHEILHLCENQIKPLPDSIIDDIARRFYAVLKNNDMLK